MSRSAIRLVKPAAAALALLPFGWLAAAPFLGWLGAEPVDTIQRVTGLGALSLLLVTLAVTPARRLAGWNDLVKLRRMLGLFAFFYAALHATSYFLLDQSLSPALIAEDVAEHPWVTAGFTALLLLVPLAVTSTNGMIRRLGGRRWRRLHRLVYPAAVLAVLHFLWLVKRDVRTPLWFAAALAILFGARVWLARLPPTKRIR